MSVPHKPFKISDLPQIASSNVNDGDLLLVSDKEAGSPTTSKKMTFKQMAAYVFKSMKSDISAIVDAAVSKIQEDVEDIAKDAAQDAVAESAQQIIDQKFDNELEERVIRILDVRSDGVQDDVITVDGGKGV